MVKVFFDMDGTVADLYGHPNWLKDIEEEKRGLFSSLKTMPYHFDVVKCIDRLQSKGVEVGVISWTPKNASTEYSERVKEEKISWIQQHFPMIEKEDIHILPYGYPKTLALESGLTRAKTLLVDDNAEVLEEWASKKLRRGLLVDKNIKRKLEELASKY